MAKTLIRSNSIIFFILFSVSIGWAQSVVSKNVSQGIEYERAQQFDKALSEFQKAINENSGDSEGYHGLMRIYTQLKRHSESIEAGKRAAELDPQNFSIRLNYGISLINARNFPEAEIHLKEAERLNPSSAQAVNMLGNLLSTVGKLEDSLDYYKKAARLSPTQAAIYHNIGLIYVRLSRVSEAIEPLETAVKLQPDYKSAWFHLGTAYTRNYQFDRGTEAWGVLRKLDPNSDQVLVNSAWNYFYREGYASEAASEAKEYLEKFGYKTRISGFLALLAVNAFRKADMNDKADLILASALENCNKDEWPYPIIQYFAAQITGEKLIELASDNDKKTEANAYLGLDLLSKGNTAEAKKYFQWVKEYGNQRFTEYPMAVVELRRLH